MRSAFPDIKQDALAVMALLKENGLYVCTLSFPDIIVWSIAEYMTLPVSQYSVLDADKVERLDDTTFKVTTSTVKFFGIKMTPVMTLTVKPHDTGCEVQMLDCTVSSNFRHC